MEMYIDREELSRLYARQGGKFVLAYLGHEIDNIWYRAEFSGFSGPEKGCSVQLPDVICAVEKGPGQFSIDRVESGDAGCSAFIPAAGAGVSSTYAGAEEIACQQYLKNLLNPMLQTSGFYQTPETQELLIVSAPGHESRTYILTGPEFPAAPQKWQGSVPFPLIPA